jgi:hypothetical protein
VLPNPFSLALNPKGVSRKGVATPPKV